MVELRLRRGTCARTAPHASSDTTRTSPSAGSAGTKNTRPRVRYVCRPLSVGSHRRAARAFVAHQVGVGRRQQRRRRLCIMRQRLLCLLGQEDARRGNAAARRFLHSFCPLCCCSSGPRNPRELFRKADWRRALRARVQVRATVHDVLPQNTQYPPSLSAWPFPIPLQIVSEVRATNQPHRFVASVTPGFQCTVR